MSLLNSQQRAFIAVDTKIDRLIIDRATEAFDALIDRGDVDAYKRLMGTAIAQMGYSRPIRQQDRPTAVDIIKTILIRAYSDRQVITYPVAVKRLRRMMSG